MRDGIVALLALLVGAAIAGLVTFAISWALNDTDQWRCVRYSGATGDCVIMQRVDYYDDALHSPATVPEDTP
jgi:hypothetical protein